MGPKEAQETTTTIKIMTSVVNTPRINSNTLVLSHITNTSFIKNLTVSSKRQIKSLSYSI